MYIKKKYDVINTDLIYKHAFSVTSDYLYPAIKLLEKNQCDSIVPISVMKQHSNNEEVHIDLSSITCLKFGYNNIRLIDNLYGLDNLTHLYLDNNKISDIQNLNHLTQLKWLDLSFNNIKSIVNVDQLINLTDLSFYQNKISEVKNLDTLTQLSTLSLGNNQISDLDKTCVSLHSLQSLRVLTLTGNVCADLPHYKQRILAYVPQLKFLDSKLISLSEVEKAVEEIKEQLVVLYEKDELIKNSNQQLEEQQMKTKEYEKMNVPLENCINMIQSPESSNETGTSRDIYSLLKLSISKEKLKDVFEDHTEMIHIKHSEFITKMKDIKSRRDTEMEDFTLTIANNKLLCDNNSKKLIEEFEIELAKLIPFTLYPDMHSLDNKSLTKKEAQSYLFKELKQLKNSLTEIEINQLEQHEELGKLIDELMFTFKIEALEIINSNFENFRNLERDLCVKIRTKFDSWHEERRNKSQDKLFDVYTGHSNSKDMFSTSINALNSSSVSYLPKRDSPSILEKSYMPDQTEPRVSGNSDIDCISTPGKSNVSEDQTELKESGHNEGEYYHKLVLLQIIDFKDEYIKLLAEWSENRIRRLDELNEFHVKKEESPYSELIQGYKTNEVNRNRKRVMEIIDYIERVNNNIVQYSTTNVKY